MYAFKAVYVVMTMKLFNNETSVGVYRLPCKDCDLAYIGESGKSLTIRMKQHESNCMNHSNPSVVVNHHELGHSIDFANSCVICPESYDKTKYS